MDMKFVSKLAPFFVVMTLGLDDSQAANWFCAQGNAASIELDGNVNYIRHYGWGLDFDEKSATANWAHIPIPTPLQKDLQAIRVAVQIYTGSNDVWISNLHVYNLANKVAELTPAGLTNEGYHTVNILLDTPVPATALSYSLKINAGVEPSSHRVIITGACALFDLSPAPPALSAEPPLLNITELPQ